MPSTILSRALAAALATTLAAAPVALAPISAAAQTAQSGAPAPAPTNAELDAVALAMLDVRNIAIAYQPRLKDAENDEKALKLRREATAEMETAVKGQGLEIDRYNAIVQAAQADEDLAATIQEKAAAAAKR